MLTLDLPSVAILLVLLAFPHDKKVREKWVNSLVSSKLQIAKSEEGKLH